MRIKSYSKINLTLRVLKKSKKGLHDIETNSTLINLFDEIVIKKSEKDVIKFKGKFKKKINIRKNSVTDTLKLLRKLKIINNFYKITVKKNIPVFAGLGGGTSNSASIVKYFFKDKLNEKLINYFVQKIGTDFRLFLNNYSFQKSLAKVIKVKNKINSHIIVIFPNIHCKTKYIYKMVKNFSPSTRGLYLKKIRKKMFIDTIKRDYNDLQKVVEKKYINISNLIDSIKKQEGCIFSRMTGSGSACYGVFKSKKTAQFAKNYLKRKYPKYWCVITKTI